VRRVALINGNNTGMMIDARRRRRHQSGAEHRFGRYGGRRWQR